MHWQTLDTIESAPEAIWNHASNYPFLSRAYLQALEATGAVSAATGWEPCHQLFNPTDDSCALLPLYLKTHSRGEYVFDQSWAGAYQRYGLNYYPKLVTAVPFTPVTGPRLLGKTDVLTREHLQHIKELVNQKHASSWHGLFVPESWLEPAKEEGLAVRSSCQFLWTDQHYQDFEGFLGALTSKRRKTLKRERSKVLEASVTCLRIEGADITPEQLTFFYQCYVSTYLVRGQRPYLNLAFFEQLLKTLPEKLMLVLATQKDSPVASALFFKDDNTLYGRYWGCIKEVDSLHFEVCYYQGIEYCLEKKLTYFDPGTQGEHKLVRGFEPVMRHSLHWLKEPAFMKAVLDYVQEENAAVLHYKNDAMQYLPFRKSSDAS